MDIDPSQPAPVEAQRVHETQNFAVFRCACLRDRSQIG